MQYKFSQKLRDKTKDYFSPLFKRDISDDEAEEWLKSLARFYDFFIDSISQNNLMHSCLRNFILIGMDNEMPKQY